MEELTDVVAVDQYVAVVAVCLIGEDDTDIEVGGQRGEDLLLKLAGEPHTFAVQALTPR